MTVTAETMMEDIKQVYQLPSIRKIDGEIAALRSDIAYRRGLLKRGGLDGNERRAIQQSIRRKEAMIQRRQEKRKKLLRWHLKQTLARRFEEVILEELGVQPGRQDTGVVAS